MTILNEKFTNSLAISRERRVPLSSRPMDFVYFSFFASHLVASFLIDLQWFYPPSIVPRPVRALLNFYLEMSGDPLIGGLAGVKHDSGLGWFKTFLTIEAIFQIPVFILGMLALWKGSKRIYPLLLIYAASSATTTAPCIVYLLSLPGTTIHTTTLDHAITFDQRLILLFGYFSFFVVPFIMVLDIGNRIHKLVMEGMRAEEQKWE